jgi:uncharacterized damage-inducible protein DinB
MPSPLDLRESIVTAWRTNSRVMLYFVENLPPELWAASVPGAPRRTIRMIAGHIHNARCMWINTLAAPHGQAVPPSVNRHRVGARQLLPALRRSGDGIAHLLQLGCDHGGTIPATRSYRWRNLPLDVGHVLGYFIAHEAHHRGQIVMAARALGHRLPSEVTAGLWQWSQRSAEAARTGVD